MLPNRVTVGAAANFLIKHMILTVKNPDGTYSEISHVAGHGIVGVAVVAVRFNYKDCGDQLVLLNEIQHSILPRMVIPTESDFLPSEPTLRET